MIRSLKVSAAVTRPPLHYRAARPTRTALRGFGVPSAGYPLGMGSVLSSSTCYFCHSVEANALTGIKGWPHRET
jgi:hypothetical protein